MVEFYNLKLDEVEKKVSSNLKEGLSNKEAKIRLEKYGKNVLNFSKEKSFFYFFMRQFNSSIFYLLMFALVFSIFLGEIVEALIIFFILLLNGLVGAFEEFKVQKTLSSLKNLIEHKIKVYRDSKLVEKDSKDLVIGDVVFLEEGDLVPADCRIISSKNLRINESTLTGEVIPVSKNSAVLNGKKILTEQKNMLFASTSIVEGNARAIVIKTGKDTQIGKIFGLVESKSVKTNLEKKLDSLGKKITYLVLIISFIVFLSVFLRDYHKGTLTLKTLINLIIFAVALAVAAVPEGLPTTVTISLTIAVKKLLKKGALIKNLSSIETLGSCSVLCVDKTGTLTKNEMSVSSLWQGFDEFKIDNVGYDVDKKINDNKISNFNFLLKIGAVCNKALLYKEDGKLKYSGDPTEIALLVSAVRANLDLDSIKEEFKIIDEIPFNSKNMFMATLVKKDNKKYIFVKGAPDVLLEKSKKYFNGKKYINLDKNTKGKIVKKLDDYNKIGLRSLAFCFKEVDSNFKELKISDIDNLNFVGLQSMIDPPRENLIDVVRDVKEAGLKVFVISGDNSVTVKNVANSVGLFGKELNGKKFDEMSDNKLKKLFDEKVLIFSRMMPEQKLRVVKLLQEKGEVVAMTGDGVNDVPSLKMADIGIAMGDSADVTKESADLVLTNNSFSTIVETIKEGRNILINIKKSITLLLSGNITEVLLIFLISLFYNVLPLNVLMILWINLVTDNAPAILLALDSKPKDLLKRHVKNVKDIFSKLEWTYLASYGIISTLIGFVLFSLFYKKDLNLAKTLIFDFIVFFEMILIFIIRKFYNTKVFENIYIYITIFITIFIQILITNTKLNKIFDTIYLSLIYFFYLFLSIVVFVILCLLLNLFKKNKNEI